MNLAWLIERESASSEIPSLKVSNLSGLLLRDHRSADSREASKPHEQKRMEHWKNKKFPGSSSRRCSNPVHKLAARSMKPPLPSTLCREKTKIPATPIIRMSLSMETCLPKLQVRCAQ